MLCGGCAGWTYGAGLVTGPGNDGERARQVSHETAMRGGRGVCGCCSLGRPADARTCCSVGDGVNLGKQAHGRRAGEPEKVGLAGWRANGTAGSRRGRGGLDLLRVRAFGRGSGGGDQVVGAERVRGWVHGCKPLAGCCTARVSVQRCRLAVAYAVRMHCGALCYVPLVCGVGWCWLLPMSGPRGLVERDGKD